jgi:regulatory protein
MVVCRSVLRASGKLPSAMRDAMQSLLRLMRAGERTSAELACRLRQRGFPVEEVDAALARARELGYVDDLRAARARVERLLSRGAPREVVRESLKDSGLPPGRVDELLVEAPADVTLARQALSLRYRGAPVPKVKAARFLSGRGFPAEVVADVVGLEDDAP